jgi:hypothetical protein
VARKRFKAKPVKVDPAAVQAAAARAAVAASRVATINLGAMTGRADITQGSRVQIASGMYAGEFAVVESVVGGVIPAAVVRTESGVSRRVRTIDLVPAPAGASPARTTEEDPPGG